MDHPRTRRRIAQLVTAIGAVAVVSLLARGPLLASDARADDRPTQRTNYCSNATCHATLLERPFVHGPAATVECLTCHDYASPEQHLFRLTTPRTDLCTQCHTLGHESVVHTPVADGNCTGCHDPHGSAHPMMLLKPPTDGLCLLCHDQKLVNNTFVHGPVAVEACVLCHDPHSSGNENVLTMSADRICFQCHSEMEPTGPAARHLHKPMEEGCTSCHDPHSSEFKHQLSSSIPGLCFTCHEGVQRDVSSASIVHGPLLDEGGCATCHNPHFTTLPRLQKSPQPDLCLDCHDRVITRPDGQTIADMKVLLADHPDHHGPIRDGECTTCHHPHAATHPGLLSKAYPAEFYAPYSPQRYELCFGCHLAGLVRDKSGTGLTKFRDGDVNLHWLHVNQEKGRTCRACHEVHASKRPFHIRESVPFGSAGWMLEINFARQEDGGSCRPACHKTQEYRRGDRAAAAGSGEAAP